MSSPCAFIRRILQSLGSSLFVRFWCRWGSRVRAATPGRKHRVNLESALLVFGYSPRHFTYLDPRIETHLKKYFIPENEDVRAYLRADMITNNGSESNLKFPGILIFTSEKMYILKIANEELGDLNRWLEKYENVPLDKVKSMKAIYFNQGISVICDDLSDNSPKGGQVSYLVLLHERRRTINFLSFLRKSEIISSERINDTLNPEVPILPQLGEEIVYFLVSEVIVIHRNLEEWKRFSLAGFAFSKSTLLILQYSKADDATSNKYETDIFIEHERKIIDLVRAADKKSLLTLQFNEKDNSMTEVWYVKTGLGMTHRIIAQLNDVWRKYH